MAKKPIYPPEAAQREAETWDTELRKPGCFAMNWDVSDKILDELGPKGTTVYMGLCYHASKDQKPGVRDLMIGG